MRSGRHGRRAFRYEGSWCKGFLNQFSHALPCRILVIVIDQIQQLDAKWHPGPERPILDGGDPLLVALQPLTAELSEVRGELLVDLGFSRRGLHQAILELAAVEILSLEAEAVHPQDLLDRCGNERWVAPQPILKGRLLR